MRAHENPDYLRSLEQAVTGFRSALSRCLELHVSTSGMPGRGMVPAVVPRDGVAPERISEVMQEVSLAAGRAAEASALTDTWVQVRGVGTIDPIRGWLSMTQPHPVLEPEDVLTACDQMIGRLEGMILKAEAEAPPEIGAEAMHPLIWGAARVLWRGRHFRQAVAAAAETLIMQVKQRVGRNDVSETSLWQQCFSSEPPKFGQPRLRWPGDPAHQDVKAMNDGLRFFSSGAQMTIRNDAAHSLDAMNEQEALERLAALSLLARWVDQCSVITAEDATL